jgi:ElaB/YqjD/DUF883 family membrane-anchored ribosome-binding protein
MDRESPELIKQGMQDTRQSLTDKVAALEQQVFGTIHEATSAVHQTVHSVKNAMNDTISSVKSTFDINNHVREHPWAMVAGAMVAGIAAGYLVGSGRKTGETSSVSDRTWASTDRANYGTSASSAPSTSRFGGMFDDLIHMGQQEFRKITENALTTLAAAVKQNLNTGIQSLVENGLSFGGNRHEPEGSGEDQNGHHNGRNRHEARF